MLLFGSILSSPKRRNASPVVFFPNEHVLQEKLSMCSRIVMYTRELAMVAAKLDIHATISVGDTVK